MEGLVQLIHLLCWVHIDSSLGVRVDHLGWGLHMRLALLVGPDRLCCLCRLHEHRALKLRIAQIALTFLSTAAASVEEEVIGTIVISDFESDFC